jgi:hypothetical protein
VTGRRPRRWLRRLRRLWAPLGLTLALIAGLLIWADQSGTVVTPWSLRCTATAAGQTVRLDQEQAVNATTIAAVAVRRGLPARAVSIALAAAFQESDLRNLDHGDRDSLGLFQQRPSQGWGRAEQVQDPVYAANRFYDELVTVPGYREMSITEAAQRVQRSAFPDAYAAHEARARVLASVLTGWSTPGLTCTTPPASAPAQPIGPQGLTPRAAAVRDDLTRVYGRLPLGGFAPGGVRSGHISGSAHYAGRALDVFVRPVGDPARKRLGWAVASWAVAHAQSHSIATVIYDDRIWSAARSEEGWRPYDAPDRPGNPATLRHLDHVHIEVAGGG